MENQSPLTSESPLDPIRTFFRQVWKISFHGEQFFAQLSERGIQPFRALAFGLICHWIGSALQTLFEIPMQKTSQVWIEEFGTQLGGTGFDWSALHSLGWFFQTGKVISDPVFTLMQILFYGLFIFVSARVLLPEETIDPAGSVQPQRRVVFLDILSLIALAYAPFFLKVVPLIGGILYSGAQFVLVGKALKIYYRISSSRAFVILIAPALAVWGFLFLLLGLMVFGFFKAIFSLL